MLSVYDLIARYANYPDGASTVGAVVSGLEVETNKRQGWPAQLQTRCRRQLPASRISSLLRSRIHRVVPLWANGMRL